jgi:5-hydroxytryptamine receptor 1
MIVILWILSFLVSIAPMFGWKDPDWDKRLESNECLVSQDVGYQIFATASSFYVPLLAILFLYWRIFLVARKRIRRRQQVKVISYDFSIKIHLSFVSLSLKSRLFGCSYV